MGQMFAAQLGLDAAWKTHVVTIHVIRIAFALHAAVGDEEQSDTYRGFWSAITDILFEDSALMDVRFEGNAREMEADQRELDANVIGQEVDAIVNVLKHVDHRFITAICRAAVEDGVTIADWRLPVVVTVFELVFDSIYELSFADTAVARGNLTFVPIVVTCILTAIFVLVENIKPEKMLVGGVTMMLRYLLEVVERLAKNLWNQRNSGNRERQCLKQEKREKQQEKESMALKKREKEWEKESMERKKREEQQEKENLERKKQEEQWEKESMERKKQKEQIKRECLKRMKREAQRGRDSQYNDMVRLQNLLDTMKEMKSNQNREPTLTFASWNVRTLNPGNYTEIKKTKRLCNMLRALDVDIAALQETRLLEKCHTFFWKGTYEKQMHGVGFAVKNELNDKIESVGEGSERLVTRRIQTTDGPVILISAYAPTEVSPSEDKGQFYKQLGDLMDTIRPHEHVILMGDFNAMVGADCVAWKDIIGPHGVKAKTNDNGTRLLEFCQKFKLCLTNTFFEPTLTHKRPGTNTWVQLDFVITRMSFCHKVVWCRSCDCASYDTDHNIVYCKVKLELKKQHESEGELKKQHESEGELKLKKQHKSEGKLKKQHKSEGKLKLKKQHESEGDVSQYNIDGITVATDTTVATDIHGATLVAVPDVLGIVRIASALGAAVGDDEQSDTRRGVWSGIMDILLEGYAREMAADQSEFDANAIVTGQVVDEVVNVLKSVDDAFVTAICRAAVSGRAASAGWTYSDAFCCVLALFGFVFKTINPFASKVVTTAVAVASILVCTVVHVVKYPGTVASLGKRVMTMLRDCLKWWKKSPRKLQNSGNGEGERLKRNNGEKQRKRTRSEQKKQEDQRKRDSKYKKMVILGSIYGLYKLIKWISEGWEKESMERKKRKEQRGRDSKYNDMVRLQNLLDTMKSNQNIEPTLTFASWNVRTLNPGEYTEVRKTERLCNMLRTLDVDIAALQETRWLGSGSEDEENYTFSWKGTEEKQIHGVGFAVKKELKDKIESVGEGSERLLTRRIQTTDGPVILISAYAPTDVSSPEDKDQFYKQLGDLMNTIRPHEHVILMGDFNAMVGADCVAWKDIIGPYGVEAKTNDNGTRLLKFCQKFKLCLTNTFYKPTLTHKRPGTNTWVQLDFVITRMSFRHKVVSCRSCDCASYDTDHNIVYCKVKLELKKQHESEGDVSNHNIEPELDLKPKKPDVDDVKNDVERKPLIKPSKCFISLKVNAASKIDKRCHKHRETNHKRNVHLKHELWHGSTDHRQRQSKRAQRR